MSITADVHENEKRKTRRTDGKQSDLEKLADDFLGLEVCQHCDWLIIENGKYICTEGEVNRETRLDYKCPRWTWNRGHIEIISEEIE